MSTHTSDGRLRILLLSNAARLEKQAAQAKLPDVRRDLLDAALILRRDAGQDLDRATYMGAKGWGETSALGSELLVKEQIHG